jgi:hypothetical protein
LTAPAACTVKDGFNLQAVLYAPDEAAAAALTALLHSGRLEAHHQVADGDSSRAAASTQQAAPDPGSVAVCLTAAAFAEPVAADEAAQRPWNRQLAALLPWLAPQHAAMAPPAGVETPVSPRRNGFRSGGSFHGGGGSEPGSPPQSPLARRKVTHQCSCYVAMLLSAHSLAEALSISRSAFVNPGLDSCPPHCLSALRCPCFLQAEEKAAERVEREATEVYAAVRPEGDEAAWGGETPELRPTLRPYQSRALAWMVRRERAAQVL